MYRYLIIETFLGTLFTNVEYWCKVSTAIKLYVEAFLKCLKNSQVTGNRALSKTQWSKSSEQFKSGNNVHLGNRNLFLFISSKFWYDSSHCNGTRTYNHLVRKRTLNRLPKLRLTFCTHISKSKLQCFKYQMR